MSDDDQPTRPSGDWAKEKLRAFQTYLGLVAKTMPQKNWAAFHYVDLFSGPGMCVDLRTGESFPGSPLIAADAGTPSSGKRHIPFRSMHFVDANQPCLHALQQRLVRHAELPCTPPYYRGDCNARIDEICTAIMRIDRGLTIVFADPTGLDIRYETLRRAAELGPTDLIINFPFMAIRRGYRQLRARQPSKLDHFLGTQLWRDVMPEDTPRGTAWRPLVDLYIQQFSALGYRSATWSDPFRSDTEAPLYHLIVFGKHEIVGTFANIAVSQRDQRKLQFE